MIGVRFQFSGNRANAGFRSLDIDGRIRLVSMALVHQHSTTNRDRQSQYHKNYFAFHMPFLKKIDNEFTLKVNSRSNFPTDARLLKH
jgi:hypothetical protein